jgi:hypothetical protein
MINSKLYKLKTKNIEIIYRDLTANELACINNLTKNIEKLQYAAKFAILDPTDTTIVPWPIMQQVGERTLYNSTKSLADKDIFDITVKEFRQRLDNEINNPLTLIGEILQVLPHQSISDLMGLTYENLIEIVCLCEKLTGKQLLDVPISPLKQKKEKQERENIDQQKRIWQIKGCRL